MAINSEIRDQAYQFFVEEAPELLQMIETGILKVRQSREKATIHSIMRAAHSLKGGAASVGLDVIKAIAHRLETIFKSLYSDHLEIDTDLEQQLLQAFDCLRVPLTEQLERGQFDEDQALTVAEPILAQLELRCREAIAATENYVPTSADLGINMTTSIFEIDVGQGLTHLAAVLAQPQNYEVAGELRAQAEVFFGFSELLNLPGFGAIAQTTLQALDQHPERAVEILECALSDFRAGQAAVLAGDTVAGGSPSAALTSLASPAAAPATTESGLAAAIEGVTPEMLTFLQQLGEQADAIEVLSELGSIGEWSDFSAAHESLNLLENLIDDTIQETVQEESEWITGEVVDEITDEIAEEIAGRISGKITGNLTATEKIEDIFGGLSETVALNDLLNESLEQAWIEKPAPGVSDSAPVQGAIAPPDAPLQPESSPPVAVRVQPKTGGTRKRGAANLTVRVDADRLLRMNNALGELTINRNGLALQNDQLRKGIRELLSRFERFQNTVQQMRSLSDQMLVAPERLGTSAIAGQRRSLNGAESTWRQPDFDALEMDNYTAIYSYTQTLLEEMVQLEEAVEDISLFNQQSEQLLGQHRKMLSQMQDELMWARMLPLGDVLNRFPRILRDLSNTYQKSVNLTLEGTQLLIDKAVLEKLYDPLLHLLRNGFDHGIETPEIRLAQGKPAEGQIHIQAGYQGRQVVIEVCDDGRGLDLQRIRQRLIELQWLLPEEVAQLSDAQLCEFIFEPGFSTAAQVSDLSGRGIGLDVVREQLRSLKGSVTVLSTPGQGTTFTLTLPLTLTITNLLICLVGPVPIALRSDGITEITIPKPDQISQVGTQRRVRWQGQEVPIYRLSELLTYACLIPELPPSRVLAAVPSPTNWEAPLIILKRGQQPYALQVDRLVTEQEFVLKPFGGAIAPPSYAYGCTVLGDGSLVPVIDGLAFLDTLVRGRVAVPRLEAIADPVPEQDIPVGTGSSLFISQVTTVLVVDDAVTSRRMLALSLERAGYRVLQARDGQEAIEQLQQSPSIQLVVCDIEMPVMNGFEFLTQRRQTPELMQIPTVMLTSRSNDKHRWLAMQLGATDYFTKPYLEQEFLGAIANLITPAIAS